MNRSMGPLLVVLGLLVVGAAFGISLFLNDDSSPKPVEGVPPVTAGGATDTTAPTDATDRASATDTTRTEAEAATTRSETASGEIEAIGSGTGGLSGAVVRADNPTIPIAGAVVELFIGPDNPAFSFAGTRKSTGKTQTTSADGTFTFDTLPASSKYCLVATAAGFAPGDAVGIVVRNDDFSVRDIELGVGTSICGEVTDLFGTPIQGAKVELFDSMALALTTQPGGVRKPMRTETVDTAGKYCFTNVSLKSFEVVASAAGFPTTSKSQTLVFQTGDQTINFALGEALGIAGFVVDEQGRAVRTATISAYQIGHLPESGTSKGESISAADGNFSITGLAKGSYMITGKAEGYTLKNHGQVEAGSNDVRVTLEAQGTVAGIVTDAVSTRPVGQYRLVLKRKVNETASVPTNTILDVSASDGAYEFVGIDPGQWVLEARAPGYANSSSRDLVVAKGSVITGVDIALDKGGSITGVVVDSAGAPIANANVRLNDDNYQKNPLGDLFESMQPNTRQKPQATITGADGRFTIGLVVPGKYQIAASKETYSDAQINGVVVEKNRVNDLGRITLSSGGTIRGQCFDQNGKPYIDGTISISSFIPPAAAGAVQAPVNGGEFRQVKTEYDGRFEVANLKPGEYVVQLMPGKLEGKDVNPFLAMVLSQKTEQRIRVDDGKISTVSLTVPAQPQ